MYSNNVNDDDAIYYSPLIDSLQNIYAYGLLLEISKPLDQRPLETQKKNKANVIHSECFAQAVISLEEVSKSYIQPIWCTTSE